jgi:hypothetical protein
MELNTLQTNVSAQTMPSRTLAEQSVSAQAPRVQPKVFPEQSLTNGSVSTPYERSANGDQAYSPEKRGVASRRARTRNRNFGKMRAARRSGTMRRRTSNSIRMTIRRLGVTRDRE